MNDLRGLSAPTTQDYERVIRGLAFERDDPAYYTVGVKIDTGIIKRDTGPSTDFNV